MKRTANNVRVFSPVSADLEIVLGSSGARADADWLRAGVSTSGALAACAGASTVYFATQPPYGEWPTLFPAMTEHVIAGAGAAEAISTQTNLPTPLLKGRKHNGSFFERVHERNVNATPRLYTHCFFRR
jgi:hypothetical protein